MPRKEDDAASGIFTYDGSFASSAQNSCAHNSCAQNSYVTNGSASFAAKVAAENERVAHEFDLPLGVYGFGGPRSTNGATSTNGSMPTDDVVSTVSGVFDMDDNSFVRGVNADAVFEAQERAEKQERERTPPGSKGEDTKGTVGDFIGGYDVPVETSPDSQGSTNNSPVGGGVLDALVRTMVSMGLAWGTPARPATPETAEKTNTPTGSNEDEAASVNGSVSILSFDGPEINSTATASKAPLFKGRGDAVPRSYPERSTVQREEKPPLLNPARLISICSCVVLLSVALALGGWVAISRRGEDSDAKPLAANPATEDDEFNSAITARPTPPPSSGPVAPPVEPSEAECGEDSLSGTFEINGDTYDCIWFSQRSPAYRAVMCDTRQGIASACRKTCTGRCAPTSSPSTSSDFEQLEVTKPPTVKPTAGPTVAPTHGPTIQPTTPEPTSGPTGKPSLGPTGQPSPGPTSLPTMIPTFPPTFVPTSAPQTIRPVASPTSAPSFVVIVPPPTFVPTPEPTTRPTGTFFAEPTPAPTPAPTPFPTRAPVPGPTAGPTASALVCPPDQPGNIPGSTTTCEQFALFHPDFRSQRCQPGWPVFQFCYATCGNCVST